MVKYFILVKKKGTAKWLGAIPAKTGVSLSKLKTTVSKSLKKGFTYKIVTIATLRKYIGKRIKQKSTGKRKRTVKRRKGTTKRKRKY